MHYKCLEYYNESEQYKREVLYGDLLTTMMLRFKAKNSVGCGGTAEERKEDDCSVE
jgi:hypothetical protein